MPGVLAEQKKESDQWTEYSRALQEMGCSRKVAVDRARKLDIVVCRHSKLYARGSLLCAMLRCAKRAV